MQQLRGGRAQAIGNEQSSGERGRGDAETNGQLLHRAGYGARAARFVFAHIRVSQGIHTGVLQRREEAVDESHDDNEPRGRAEIDRGEQHDHDAEQNGIGDEDRAIAESLQNQRHGQFQAHRGKRLRHDQQSGLERRESESDLIQQRQ